MRSVFQTSRGTAALGSKLFSSKICLGACKEVVVASLLVWLLKELCLVNTAFFP